MVSNYAATDVHKTSLDSSNHPQWKISWPVQKYLCTEISRSYQNVTKSLLYLKTVAFSIFFKPTYLGIFIIKNYLIFCTWLIISLNSNQRERYNFFCGKYFSGMKIFFLIITITIYLIFCFRALLQRHRFDSTKGHYFCSEKERSFHIG